MVAARRDRARAQGSDAYGFVARSNPVRFAGGAAEPTQAHVTLTGNPTEML